VRAVPIVKFVQEEDRVEWLVADLLPSVGFTLFVGRKGIGKTTFAIQLCAALQAGTSFLGRNTLQRNILYIQADSVDDEWRDILRRVAPDSRGYTVVDVPSRCLDIPEHTAQLQDKIQKVQPGFIVFDSLYNMSARPINTEAVQIPVNIMIALTKGLPWLLIHHPPHHESRASGHHSLGAKCSNEWHLERNKLIIDKGRLVKTKEILITRDARGLWCAREDKHEDDDLMHKELI